MVIHMFYFDLFWLLKSGSEGCPGLRLTQRHSRAMCCEICGLLHFFDLCLFPARIRGTLGAENATSGRFFMVKFLGFFHSSGPQDAPRCPNRMRGLQRNQLSFYPEETDQTNMHPSGSESSGLVFWWYAEIKISSPSSG